MECWPTPALWAPLALALNELTNAAGNIELVRNGPVGLPTTSAFDALTRKTFEFY